MLIADNRGAVDLFTVVFITQRQLLTQPVTQACLQGIGLMRRGGITQVVETVVVLAVVQRHVHTLPAIQAHIVGQVGMALNGVLIGAGTGRAIKPLRAKGFVDIAYPQNRTVLLPLVAEAVITLPGFIAQIGAGDIAVGLLL